MEPYVQELLGHAAKMDGNSPYDYSCKWDSGSKRGISISVGDARNSNAGPDPIVFEDP